MATKQSSPSVPDPFPQYPCVEHGVWSEIPVDPPEGDHRLKLKDVAAAEARSVKQGGVMTFHAVGCSGDFTKPGPGKQVAEAMAAQISRPRVYGGSSTALAPSFFFHLGDVVYKDDDPKDPTGKDQGKMYNEQFYTQYKSYGRTIFAIAGNHDCKLHPGEKHKKAAMLHFLDNFCAQKQKIGDDNQSDKRTTMVQPYPYWLLETPVAYVIGLFTNDLNGGQLDDPMHKDAPQYKWLVQTLLDIKSANDDKAVLLALHYPPYSGAADFSQRGDPNLGPTPRRNPPAGILQPLGIVLQHAFQQTGLFPHLVLSAHAHHYQRITYTLAGGHEIPYLIAGSGGHVPIEKLGVSCWKKVTKIPDHPFDVALPRGLTLPPDDTAQVVAYNDDDTGFLRLTIDINRKQITGEFFAVSASEDSASSPKLFESFVLDMAKRKVTK